MTYGIDQIVQDKADAYRGNPAALQKRHAANKELIDLLALQKITSEKDAAARDMQMSMEQQPGTIAQQLEQKAVGQTKDEMLKGIAGVMKTNQAKQQANMQRMASAGLPKTAAAGPPPQGLAAQPKPNMQRMAQGGIVGFSNGGQADGYEEARKAFFTEDQIEAAKKRGIDAAGMIAMRDAQKALDPMGRRPDFQKASGTPSLPDPVKAPPQAVFGMEDEYDDKPPVVQPPKVGPPAAGINTLSSGLGQVDAPTARTKFLDPAGYAVKMADATSTADAKAGIKGLMDQDPKAARAEAMKYGLAELGMSDDRKAAEKARQGALAELDARQQDPEKLERERRSAFLRGISKSGSFAGGSQGMANLRAQQELAERNRLLGRQGIERSFEDEQQRIREKAFSSAQEAYKIANENVRSGVSAITQFNATEIGMLSNNAKSKLQADKANMEAEDRSILRTMEAAIHNASQEVKVAVANLEAETSDRKMNLQAELDMLKIEQLDRGKAEDTLSKVAKYMGDVRNKYEKIYQDRIANLPMGTDQSVVQALREEMNSAIIISLKPLADRAKAIEARIAGTYGDPSGKYQQGSMTVSP